MGQQWLLIFDREYSEALRKHHAQEYYVYSGTLLAGFPARAEVMDIPIQIVDLQKNEVIHETKTKGPGRISFAINGSLLQDPKHIEIRFPKHRVENNSVENSDQ